MHWEGSADTARPGGQGQGDWKALCSDQVLPKEAEELSWTRSYKTWTDAIDK